MFRWFKEFKTKREMFNLMESYHRLVVATSGLESTAKAYLLMPYFLAFNAIMTSTAVKEENDFIDDHRFARLYKQVLAKYLNAKFSGIDKVYKEYVGLDDFNNGISDALKTLEAYAANDNIKFESYRTKYIEMAISETIRTREIYLNRKKTSA
jgi:hypothetical protein